MVLRSRPAQRLTPRFRFQATWGARKPYPDSSPVPSQGRPMRLAPAQLVGSRPRLRAHLLGQSPAMARATPRHLLLVRVARSRRLPLPSPAVRRDGPAYLLRDLYPSPAKPATADDSERAADHAAYADIRALAAPPGETPAQTLDHPDVDQQLNPESPQRQSADYSEARIPRTIQHTSSLNTRRLPGLPSAPSPFSRLMCSLPELPFV